MVSNEPSSKPTVKDEVSSSKPTVKNEASSEPTAGPAGPFDFSALSGLVNDPSIEELAEQIAKNPKFDYRPTMFKVMENPDFKTLAMRLANAMIQDPSISSMLHNYTNPPNQPSRQERMARINEDPSLKHILDELEAGGPAEMMRYWNDEEVLNKLGLAMGINPNTAAASSDNPLGPEEDCKKLLFGFVLKLNLVDYLNSRPFGPKSLSRSIPFYQIVYGRALSGENLCVQETEPVNWREALLPLLAKLKEEEKGKVAKLEEKVDLTEHERLKLKVPRFTKESILVIFLHHILDDMRRHNSCVNHGLLPFKMPDVSHIQGREAQLASVLEMLAKKKESVDEMYRAKLGQKGRLKRPFEDLDDTKPN